MNQAADYITSAASTSHPCLASSLCATAIITKPTGTTIHRRPRQPSITHPVLPSRRRVLHMDKPCSYRNASPYR
ncbi:hypothetical protein BC567DRAFT_226393 [Phyllosticta citribraziliensis]